MLYLFRYSLQNGQTFLPGAKQLDYHHDSQLFLCFFVSLQHDSMTQAADLKAAYYEGSLFWEVFL